MVELPPAARAACVFCCVLGLAHGRAYGQAKAAPTPEVEAFRELAAQLASEPPDDCGWAKEAVPSTGVHKVEDKLLERAENAVLASMNGSPATPAPAGDAVLQEFEEISSHEDASWPQERRFHYRLLDLKTAMVLQLTIRSRATFSVFAVPVLLPEGGRKKNGAWRQVGTDSFRWEEHVSDEQLAIFPLERGPSNEPRFLARFEHVSCGDGQEGIDYAAYQWDSSWTGNLQTILHQAGVLSGEGMFDEVESPGSQAKHITVSAIGKLEASGKSISLPYCWHSAVDTYVWATLCSVDTYDLSADRVRFIGRSTNRPDLETVARAIEYAQARDLAAILAYTADGKIAVSLVQDIPPEVFCSSLTLSHPAPNKEEIEMEDGRAFKFEVAKFQGRWVVTEFSLVNE